MIKVIVIVGIFSIIVVMTIVTMLQNTINEGFQFLSKNTFQIQKWPAIQTGGHQEHQKYRNRKDITLEDFFRFESIFLESITKKKAHSIKQSNSQSRKNGFESRNFF